MLLELAPSLRLPAGTAAADDSVFTGFQPSINGASIQVSSQIRTPSSPGEFVAFLAEQMSAQGWQIDSRWSGSVSHGSRWTKSGSDAPTYWATVELVEIGDGRYDLSYRGI
jgi:hypothetical protein